MKKVILILIASALFYASGAFAAVNINTGDAAALANLDGIGPVKAEAIVAYRQEHGNFESLDGLSEVNGIGSKTVDGLRDNATIGADE